MVEVLFQEFIARYQEMVQTPLAGNVSRELLTEDLKNEIASHVSTAGRFKVVASVGKGGWAEVPWLAVLDPRITVSTQNGYYVVFLIDSKKKALYLSLMLGWTQFDEEFGGKEGRQRTSEYASFLARHLEGGVSGFRAGEIDLSACGIRARGYESGQILSRRYSVDDLDSADLLHDLTSLLEIHGQLVGLIGSGPLNVGLSRIQEGVRLTEEEILVNRTTMSDSIEESLEQLDLLFSSAGPEQQARILNLVAQNRTISRLVKEREGFVCEVCERLPFTQKMGNLTLRLA